MTFCVTCESLKDQLQHQDNIIATLEQEARQQHARNVRLQQELDYANKLIGELRETTVSMPMSYAQIKESFSR